MGQKQQEGCTCVAHQASPRGRCADYQTGCSKHLFFFLCFTCVEHLLDDHGHLALQYGVEQLDDEDQAGTEDEQRRSQQNEAHSQVRQIGIGKDVLACSEQMKISLTESVHSTLTLEGGLLKIDFTATCL